jgi:hypothetical protein
MGAPPTSGLIPTTVAAAATTGVAAAVASAPVPNNESVGVAA